METKEAIRTRRSVLKFKTEKVPEEKIRWLMEAGLLAPSAGNTQPIEFVLVTDEKQKEKLAQLKYEHNFREQIEKGKSREEADQMCAPQREAFKNCVPIAIIYPKDRFYRQTQSAWCCITAMWLAAPDIGLGLSPAFFDAGHQQGVKDCLGLPDNYDVPAVLRIGVPDGLPDAKPRKPLDSCLHVNRFGETKKP